MYSLTLIVVFLSIFVPLITTNICYCLYSDSGMDFLTNTMTTEFSRKFIKGINPCEGKYSDLCFVYATLPQNASHYVIINAQAGLGVKALNITFTSLATDESSTKLMVLLPQIHGIDSRSQRNIFSVTSDQLKPNN